MPGKLKGSILSFASMSVRRLIALNLALVAAVFAFGLATDEPYWRAMGHSPWTYDYLFWVAMALNGPSGFLADRISCALGFDLNLRFLVQYIFWMILLVLQWTAYARIGSWAALERARERSVRVLAVAWVLVGCVFAAYVWAVTADSMEYFVDVYFWPVRILGIALSGVWVYCLCGACAVRSTQIDSAY